MYDLNDIYTAKGIHLAHLNIRSLPNKWEVFKTQFMSSNLHILGVSETWLNDKLPSEMFKLSNEYSLIRNYRKWTDERTLETKKRQRGCYLHKEQFEICKPKGLEY